MNISNDLCNVNSEVFEIVFVPTPMPPSSIGDVRICENIGTGLLTARVPPGIRVDWYDAPTGGNLLATNTITYSTEVQGTYYAEAVPDLAYCPSDTRTPVTLEFYPLPEVTDESLIFCEGGEIVLEAGVSASGYLWNTGETAESISVSLPGTYTVEVRDSRGCTNVKTIELSQIASPSIETIFSRDDDIVIRTTETGGFQYSLDGVNFQGEPIFEDMPGGLYTMQVRGGDTCPPVTQEFFHLAAPKFFTPNGDGVNDFFEISGIDALTDYEINLYDRYGKLIKNSVSEPLRWDGNFNNRMMPSGDYWYTVRIEGKTKQGHFALVR